MSEEHDGYADECGDHGGINRHDNPCGRPAGWGTDFDSGKCKNHRGTNADGSSHKNNQNASIHGLYSDHSNYYQALSDTDQQFVDLHYEKFVADAPFDDTNAKAGILFEIAVNHHKRLSSDGTIATEGMSETKPVPGDGALEDTKEHHLHITYDRLARTDIRRLKDLGVLDDPDTQQAEATESVAAMLGDSS